MIICLQAIDLSDHLARISAPPMLLQPVVENAVKHSLGPTIEGGKISIYISDKNDIVHIHVCDTGPGQVFPLRANRPAGETPDPDRGNGKRKQG